MVKKKQRRAPRKAITFVDMNGISHDALTTDVLTGHSDGIDVMYFYRGQHISQLDVPKKTETSKRYYWFI